MSEIEGLSWEKIKRAAEILDANELPRKGRMLAVPEFFRRPKSKKRRILAKWMGRPENWRMRIIGPIDC